MELPADFLANLDEAKRAEQWRERIEGGTGVLLAERAGRVVGFCAHGWRGPAEDSLTRTWEIYGLHVTPELRGRGIGSFLFDEARRLGVQAGAPFLTLWVVASNAPARRFYEAKLMMLDGAEKHRELAPGVALHEVRYRAELRSNPLS